jgi:flagellar biosynthesis component FlhA
MGINDPMEKSEVAAEIVDEAERSVEVMLVRSGMTGMISLIPGIGDTINQMLTELAFKRTHDRMRRMFQEMSSRIREVNQDKIEQVRPLVFALAFILPSYPKSRRPWRSFPHCLAVR